MFDFTTDDRDRRSAIAPSATRLRTRARHGVLVLLALLLMFPATLDFARPAVAQTSSDGLPDGFEDELIARLHRPMGLGFTPDGRLLIATKAGQVWIVADDVLTGSPALDLSAKLCTERNRGLLGIAVDPKFSKNRFIYLSYTFDKFNDNQAATGCQKFGEEVPVTRVSRFVLARNGTVDPASERVLLDNIPSLSDGNHDAGDLGFGKDRRLYVSIGDGDCDVDDTTKCQVDNPNAQRMNMLYGKIVRISRNGGIPRDNPYRGAGTKRCGRKGVVAKNTCREIYASGLRNAFRIAFDPECQGNPILHQRRGRRILGGNQPGQGGSELWMERAGRTMHRRFRNELRSGAAALHRPDSRLPAP